MAYPVKMAAALSGATVNQLRHWRSARTGPLLVPEIATTPKVLYSFKDVLALRTCVRLREDASLQKIRAAIQNLRDLGEADHLATYRLVSDRRGSIQLVSEDEVVNLGSGHTTSGGPADNGRVSGAVVLARHRGERVLLVGGKPGSMTRMVGRAPAMAVRR